MLSCIFFLYVVLLLCSSDNTSCFARDTLTLGHPLNESEGLVSAGKKFELGFFSPTGTGSSNGRYVGIWYHDLTPKTVVWVANRGKALPSKAVGVFAITEGNLNLLDSVTGKLYFSSKLNTSSSSKMMAKIMDSGNLVLSDGDQLGADTLWQSFQNPTDTFIPGMLMDTGLELTSWIDKDNPGNGSYVFKVDQEQGNQFMISKNSRTYWRTERAGPLFRSVELPSVITYLLTNFSKSTVSSRSNFNTTGGFNYTSLPRIPRFDYTHARLVMTSSGKLQASTLIEGIQQWDVFWSVPQDECSVFNACGNFGSCNSNNVPVLCKCLPGFNPLSPDKWNSGDFSDGCTRGSQICGVGDTFLSLKMMKAGKEDREIIADNETDCKNRCLKDCQCQAYSYSVTNVISRRDFYTYSMCKVWYSGLNNLQEEYGINNTIAVRVASSDIESTVRDCEPCGTTLIPYPLSTRVGCGDSMYFRFKCDSLTGQVSFVGSNDRIFRVVNISQSSQRFFIQGLGSNVDNCNSKNGDQSQQLNATFPFKVINWCSGDRRNFNSDSSTSPNVIEIGWEPPLEPICTKLEDCSDWPHSTCSPARDGEKRCLCNTNYQWKDLNCSQEGNLQELPPKSSRKGMPLSLVVVAVCVSGTFLACIIVFYVWRRKMTKRRDQVRRGPLDSERRVKELMDTSDFKEEDDTGIDVPFFDLQSILDATDNFSIANKLGQGGYGPVYKGILPGGQEIAVKRLSRVSGQGMQEFKNEVVLIAKLQHRNLVRLKGYCMKGEEKILLYEYMPNKSLDSFIFDHTQSVFLNWEMRFNIILGVSRGLLYLHQDSRLRIIHRDMKTSNILLDEEMTPKISDFGLARIVGGKETEANTNTVVGTYGYMSPEYALDGTFSVKSDVFSFGVVLLEIVSGKKNTGFYQSKQNFSLLAYAWQLWTEDKVLDLMDKSLEESCNTSEFIKCVNVALLCIQEDPVDRPTMSNVITMLDSEATVPATPKQPAFFLKRGNSSTASSSTKPETISEITTLEGR